MCCLSTPPPCSAEHFATCTSRAHNSRFCNCHTSTHQLSVASIAMASLVQLPLLLAWPQVTSFSLSQGKCCTACFMKTFRNTPQHNTDGLCMSHRSCSDFTTYQPSLMLCMLRASIKRCQTCHDLISTLQHQPACCRRRCPPLVQLLPDSPLLHASHPPRRVPVPRLTGTSCLFSHLLLA